MVGCSSTETYGKPASRSRPSAAEVFAICISDSTPSCMRAPPEAQNITAGTCRSSARSNARVIFSPTTEPIEPPMNSNTKNPSLDRRPVDRPRAGPHGVRRRPVFRRAARSRSA